MIIPMTATEASKKFSEATRIAGRDGPVEISTHGHVIAYLISAEDYRRLTEKENTPND